MNLLVKRLRYGIGSNTKPYQLFLDTQKQIITYKTRELAASEIADLFQKFDRIYLKALMKTAKDKRQKTKMKRPDLENRAVYKESLSGKSLITNETFKETVEAYNNLIDYCLYLEQELKKSPKIITKWKKCEKRVN